MDLADATSMAEELQTGAFRDFHVGLLHGRMKPDEKDAVMRRFKAGDLHVLVATTVIEVGIDVPNASVMLIEHAERFGLSQLHQLRGRVGRGPWKSYCILLTAASLGEEAQRRIDAMVATTDGFKIAEADLKAATTMAERLARVFKEFRVGLVHGRLRPEERDAVMRAFRDNAIQVLVATSVIEVGIDVPNATVMLIEHAERFGLAQLHQLRGRVGRGSAASHCILVSDAGDAVWRLRAFTETTDGFKIAELDLQERGMGQLAGVRQSGGMPLRYANFATDLDLLEAARRAAKEIIDQDPALALPKHAAYRANVLLRYERGFELFRVG